jgi:hypothetical protein
LLALLAGLYGSGRRRLAGRLLVAFLATGLLEHTMKQVLPVPPIPLGTVRAEDFVPLATVEHSYPCPSGHALHDPSGDRLSSEAEPLFARWDNAVAVGDVGEPGIPQSALDIGRRGRSAVGRHRRSLGF